MYQPLALCLASRFSRARKRHHFVSFISMAAMIGIALGVAVVIIGLSAMNGFERELKDRVLAVIPHGELQAVKPPLYDWQPLAKGIRKHPEVVGVAPYIDATALVERGSNLKAVKVRGVDPALESQVSVLSQYIDAKAWQSFQAGHQQVIIGQGVAKKLGVGVGDWLTVMLPNHHDSQKLSAAKRVRVQVHGLLSLHGQLDHHLILMPLADLQADLGYGLGVSGLSLKTRDLFDAPRIIKEAGQSVPIYAYIHSWKRTYGNFYRDIALVRTMVYVVMVLMIGVACFNIVSTLMMAVKDRASDIAILRTMGAQDSLIRRIFMSHGLMTGMVGSLFGVLIGVPLSLFLTPITRTFEQLLGRQFLNGDIYFIDFIPTQLIWSDVAIVTVTAMVLSLLASWYPARRASRINPAQVLSGK
ncbi:Lipoprotein-releasing system transmembrane protein LolE [Vibrio stylophorae]|uniref:Lipoprotein-releasing system transmembrane protein LolE n=1 Tax=Vibrio stylophorae TaxID=659351 RepID=A0ABM8ZUY3_9VIBR|nr:lipoprotein-releasing ABC transporter permease subunit LolE [Vibrio stylophorae]CAH0533785.1 Lipoprotein-releasing system transmembrane protein LolE [Vibrio stylophorae]